ncbi:hypothetical protein PIB30_001993 [Stylosanthes scabra]|uniref:VQ domain-containing protein n=1 Tax=Stylosanthes scabra TaxID=79078 RepID=A0ABU6Z038_9FABA|nr:hypothetical protein [Stylosanthes scabra]
MRSDAKFLYEEEKTRTTKKAVVMNGPRPSPLMINKDSHFIRKPSSSSSDHQNNNNKIIRKPIIIYTQSPKIIHTKAQDFMALVQRLTGKSPPTSNNNNSNNEASDNFGSSLSDGSNNSIKQQMNHHQWKKSEVDETSSALRRDDDDDKKGGASIHHHDQFSPNSSLLSFADMPLFTPNSSSDIFCSSSTRSLLFKHSDSSPYGILGNLISPSGLEFIKELPEY